MNILIYLTTGLLIIATLLPLWRNPHWLVRSADFPRMQLAVVAALLISLQIIFLDFSTALPWVFTAATTVCLVWQLWWVLPYTKLWPVEVKACENEDKDRQISILTANVLTSNRDANKLLALVRQYRPDVLVTLESDRWWEDQLAGLEKDMPNTIKCPLDNLYGMHVYSRLPLHDTKTSFLVEDEVPSMHALVQLPTGDQVRLHVLHPAPPSPTENPESAERDAELVIVARNAADNDGPTIVTGDLNDVAWSRTTHLFRKLSGMLDPRVSRGMFNTFHVSYSFLRWPLDHVFHSDHFTVVSIRRMPSIGSDHFPLFSQLALTPEKGKQQKSLDAVGDDQEFADSVARNKGVRKEDVP